MGGKPSLLEKPWREVSQKRVDNLDFVRSYVPHNREVKQLRILLHGPVGAGKSSFINSVDSVLQGRHSGRAMTDAISGSSFTQQYKTFKFKKGNGQYSVVFNDMMGLEPMNDKGVSIADMELALNGHVEEGYKFNPDNPLQVGDLGYRANPTLQDKVHVLVSVVNAASVSILDPGIVKKMREVRLIASNLGIPQLVILTKVDLACQEAQKNSGNIYRSIYLKEQVENFHNLLGISLNCIFLVKNYNLELDVDDDISAVILCALRQMIYFGDDHTNNP